MDSILPIFLFPNDRNSREVNTKESTL